MKRTVSKGVIGLKRNLQLMRVISFIKFATMVFPVIVPLMKGYGLTMGQIMISQSVFSAAMLLLEIPAGIFADRLGRRPAILMGGFCYGTAFSVLPLAQSFELLCLFEMLLGISFSFIGGADTSLTYETEKSLGLPSGVEVQRIHTLSGLGEAVAAVSCSLILLISDMSALLAAQQVTGWVIFFSALFLTEPPRINNCEQPKQNLTVLMKKLIHTPNLFLLILIFLSIGVWTYFMAWLLQPLMIHHQIPEKAFGLFMAMASMMVALSSRMTTSYKQKLSQAYMHSILPVIIVMGYVVLLIESIFAVIIATLAAAMVRGILVPLVQIVLNEAIEDEDRATMNSLITALFRIVTMLFGPIIGLGIDVYGLYSVIFALAGFILPGIGLLVVWQHNAATALNQVRAL